MGRIRRFSRDAGCADRSSRVGATRPWRETEVGSGNTASHLLTALLLLSVLLAGCAEKELGLPDSPPSLVKSYKGLQPGDWDQLDEGKVALLIEFDEPLLRESLDAEAVSVTPSVPWRLLFDGEPWDQPAEGGVSFLAVELDATHLLAIDSDVVEVTIDDDEVIAALDEARYPLIFKHRMNVNLSGLTMPPIIITEPSQGDLLGLGHLRNSILLHVTFLAEDPGDFVVPSLTPVAGGASVTSQAPFPITTTGGQARIDSVKPVILGGRAYHEVKMALHVWSGVESKVNLQLELHSGGAVQPMAMGSDSVEFTLDLVEPQIFPKHTSRTDESDQDLFVNRVCVEASEELSGIRPSCNGAWLTTEPVGSPERITKVKEHPVYCIHSLPVPQGCSQLEVEALDRAGNESQPHDFGDYVCQTPSKYVWPGGRRNALVVDDDDRTHVAFILEDGVYYANPGLDGHWQREPIHCACGFNPDTGRCLPNTCKKQYGLNVGLAVDDEGTPGVCFVFGDKVGADEDYVAAGEIHVRWRFGAQAGQNWPGQVPATDEARMFHCALDNAGLFGDPDYPGETVVYVEGQKGTTGSKLVSRMHVSSSSWLRKEIAGFLGREVSMVSDADGRLHLVFRGSSTTEKREREFRLSYARHPKGMTGGNWQTVEMEDQLGRAIWGSRPSLALSPSDHLAISYLDGFRTTQMYAERIQKVGQFTGPEVWGIERVLQGDPVLGAYLWAEYREVLNPGGLATQDNVYVGAPSQLIFDSQGQPRVVFVIERRHEGGYAKDMDLGELIVATRDLNRDWHHSVLDGRVEGAVDISTALNSAGRLRILFHNGLHPPDAAGDGAHGSLQYWHAESKSAIYAHPDDYVGTDLLPNLDSCAAHLHKRQDEPANRLSEAQLNLDPEPEQLVLNSDAPSDRDLIELFERIRRYRDVSAIGPALPPLPAGTASWDVADMTDPAIQDLLMEQFVLRPFLVEFERFAGNLESQGGFAARLNPPPNILADPPQPVPPPPASLQTDLLDGSLMEDIFGDLEIRSNLVSPLVKDQRNVCEPSDCSLRDSLISPAQPVTGQMLHTPTRFSQQLWSSLDLKQAAKECAAQSGVLVVRANAQALIGCYRCSSPNPVVMGLPTSDQPVCAPESADGEDPDYRMMFDYRDGEVSAAYPYITCLESGCDDTRYPSQKCPEATFDGPAGQVHYDEEWAPVPGRGLCVRCEEGTMQVNCAREDSAKCGDGGYGCAVSDKRERCEIVEHTCTTDRDCDVAEGYGCVQALGKCYKLQKCVGPSFCPNPATDTCVNGLCRQLLQSCSLGLGSCPPAKTCVNTGFLEPGLCMPRCLKDADCTALMTCTPSMTPWDPNTTGHCSWEVATFDPSAFRCQSIGCTTCLNNAYCLDPEDTEGDPWCEGEGCTACPAGHSCATQGEAKTPFCLVRPLLDDFFVPLMGGFLGQEAGVLFDLPDAIHEALSGVEVPTKLEGRSIRFSERIERGGFRLRGHPLGSQHQGYIVFALEFADDVEINTTCDASITIPKPVMRIRFQPFSYAGLDATGQVAEGAIYATPVDMGIYDGLDSTEPIPIDSDNLDCMGSCGLSCGFFDQSDLQNVHPELNRLLEGELRDQLHSSLNQVLDMLLGDMVVGGWLFGRTFAIDELDVARDSVPGPSTHWTGDANPEDEIQRLLIRPSPGAKPGWGRVDYLER